MSEVILGIVCLPAQTVFVVIYQKKKLCNCYTEWVFYKWSLMGKFILPYMNSLLAPFQRLCSVAFKRDPLK
jgi:hypothetical protein